MLARGERRRRRSKQNVGRGAARRQSDRANSSSDGAKRLSCSIGGVPPAVARAETERDWQAAIRGAHGLSTVNAVIDFVLGGGEAALGVYLLVAKPTGGWGDRRAQTTRGGAMAAVQLTF
jgi:hypothetical protein